MIGQFKSLLMEPCYSNDLYIHYRRFEETEWMSQKLKKSKSKEEIHDIDPCEKYEIRVAPGSNPTHKFKDLTSIGPYYETLNEVDLNKVELDNGRNYYKNSLNFGVSQFNESFVTLDYGQVCAMKIKVYSKYMYETESELKIEGEITSDKKVSILLMKGNYVSFFNF